MFGKNEDYLNQRVIGGTLFKFYKGSISINRNHLPINSFYFIVVILVALNLRLTCSLISF